MRRWRLFALIFALVASAALKAPLAIQAISRTGSVTAGGWPSLGMGLEVLMAAAVAVPMTRRAGVWLLLWGSAGAVVATTTRILVDGPGRPCGCLGVVQAPNGAILAALGIVLWFAVDAAFGGTVGAQVSPDEGVVG